MDIFVNKIQLFAKTPQFLTKSESDMFVYANMQYFLHKIRL